MKGLYQTQRALSLAVETDSLAHWRLKEARYPGCFGQANCITKLPRGSAIERPSDRWGPMESVAYNQAPSRLSD
jgi:hypothetical protein